MVLSALQTFSKYHEWDSEIVVAFHPRPMVRLIRGRSCGVRAVDGFMLLRL